MKNWCSISQFFRKKFDLQAIELCLFLKLKGKKEGRSIAVKRVTYHYELIDRVVQTISDWADMLTSWTLTTSATQETVSQVLYAKRVNNIFVDCDGKQSDGSCKLKLLIVKTWQVSHL